MKLSKSFVTGFFSTFTPIFAAGYPYRVRGDSEIQGLRFGMEHDAKSLADDWKRIGDDFRNALKNFEKENEREPADS